MLTILMNRKYHVRIYPYTEHFMVLPELYFALTSLTKETFAERRNIPSVWRPTMKIRVKKCNVEFFFAMTRALKHNHLRLNQIE